MQDGGQSNFLSSTSLELHNNPIRNCEEACDEDSELVSAIVAYCTTSENKMNSTRDTNGSESDTPLTKTHVSKVRKSSKVTPVADRHCESFYIPLTVAAEDVKDVQMNITNKTHKKQKCNKDGKPPVSALADITAQINVPVAKPRKHQTVSSCNKCDKSRGNEGSEQMSVTSAYCRTSENKVNNKQDVSVFKKKISVTKTDDDKVRKASKLTPVGDGQCRSSNKPQVGATENVKHFKMKVANKLTKKQKYDKADCVVADITDQIDVSVTKSNKSRTASSCNICDEPCYKNSKLLSLMTGTSENKDVNRSKVKTAVKKIDNVKLRTASKSTPVNDNHHHSCNKAADSFKDLKMQVASKTPKKQKCNKSDDTDRYTVSVIKPRKSKTGSSRTNKCTDLLRAGKADAKGSGDQFKRKRLYQEGMAHEKSAIQSGKMTDSGATACILVNHVNVSEDARKATKERSVTSHSDVCLTTSPQPRTSCFTAGGSACKQDIAALSSDFDRTCQLSKTTNDSITCKKDSCAADCSQQKKDSAKTVNKTKKQYKYILPCSTVDVSLQTRRTNHFASGDTCAEQAADKENCEAVNNGSLETAVKENKYTRPCSDLDMSTQSCESVSYRTDGITTTHQDVAELFHMTLRPRTQCQYAEQTTRKRTASVLITEKHYSINSDDKLKTQEEPSGNNGQMMRRCSVVLVRNCKC